MRMACFDPQRERRRGMRHRRVAFFTDSFHEVNGVALTSREYVNFARRQGIPVFSVHAGPETRVTREGSITTFEFRRGPVRWNLEHDLAVDFMAWRHNAQLMAALREFGPELIHITGPGDAGILGAVAAWRCKVPLAASWHTNVHEYAGRRLIRTLGFLHAPGRRKAGKATEAATLEMTAKLYSYAKVIYAPNPELVQMLREKTRRPVHGMSRGIDTVLFDPAKRARGDEAFVIGYVGRLSTEKNVRMLAAIEEKLRQAGVGDYRFLIIGEGAERNWLRSTMKCAELPGVKRGEELARAFASMDVFVFPSFTDTFGNVVVEAMASGVPPIVASGGGPKFLFEHETEGLVAGDAEEFAAAILTLYRDRGRLAGMRQAARRAAEKRSWDAVFTAVHEGYDDVWAGSAGS